MRKVIVTGANGFIGKYLVNELLTKGVSVLGITRHHDESNDLVLKNYDQIEMNLEDIEQLTYMIKSYEYDTFYHMAWDGSAGEERGNWCRQLENIKYTCKAVETANKLGCKRFIGIGSMTEIMAREYIPKDESTPEIVACYAVGKMASEYFSKCICNNLQMDYIWTYLANVYGPGSNEQNIIEYLVRCYSQGIAPSLTDGDQMADFTYVSDIANALYLIGDKGKSNCTYYVGYGNPRPLKEFVLVVRDMINKQIETGLGNKKFNGQEINFNTLEFRRIHDELGFLPKIDFEVGIKATIGSGE